MAYVISNRSEHRGPRDMIRHLDDALARSGQGVVLQRRVRTSGTFVQVAMLARITGFTAAELVGGVKQTDSKFVLSPSALRGTRWPGSAGGLGSPAIGDFLVINGKQRSIQQIAPVVVADVVVRWEGTVRG